MSDRERSSPTLIESGLKNLIGGRDNYPLISGNLNGECFIYTYFSLAIYQTCNTYLIVRKPNIPKNFDLSADKTNACAAKFCSLTNCKVQYCELQIK